MDHLQKSIDEYIHSLNHPHIFPGLDLLYDESVKKKIPVLRKNTARLLFLLIKMKSPKTILEIGTGSTYSTQWIISAASEAHIVTLERDKNRYEAARKYLSRYPNVDLVRKDVFNYLPNCSKHFDFILLDSQKRDYIELLPMLTQKLNIGGFLFTDNILFGGKAACLSEEQKAKYQGGVERLRAYNKTLSLSPYFETVFLDIDDGVALSIKIQDVASLE